MGAESGYSYQVIAVAASVPKTASERMGPRFCLKRRMLSCREDKIRSFHSEIAAVAQRQTGRQVKPEVEGSKLRHERSSPHRR